MTRLPRAAADSTPGAWLPLVAVLIAGTLYGCASAFLLLSNLWHADGRAVVLNGVLLAVLAASVAGWTLAVVRRRVAARTGAGLVLAAGALAASVFVEFSACMFPTPLEVQLDGHHLVTLVAWIRPVSLAAFGYGLAMTALAYRRERHEP